MRELCLHVMKKTRESVPFLAAFQGHQKMAVRTKFSMFIIEFTSCLCAHASHEVLSASARSITWFWDGHIRGHGLLCPK